MCQYAIRGTPASAWLHGGDESQARMVFLDSAKRPFPVEQHYVAAFDIHQVGAAACRRDQAISGLHARLGLDPTRDPEGQSFQ